MAVDERPEPYRGMSSRAIEPVSAKHLGFALLAVLEEIPSLPQDRPWTKKEESEIAFARQLLRRLQRQNDPRLIEGLIESHIWRLKWRPPPPRRKRWTLL